MRSAIYYGRMGHIRHSQKPHKFYYDIAYLLLDLDEKSQLREVTGLFGWNSKAWLSYNDEDHGRGGPESFREWLEDCMVKSGLGDGCWRFSVLCLPRVFGYCFNPISIIYCYNENKLQGMVYEVNNTFGERVHYIVPVRSQRGLLRQRCEKSLYVSPFFEVNGHYEFKISEPAKKITSVIDYYVGEKIQLRALFKGFRSEFTSGGIRKMLRASPFLSAKVITLIHYQALRLWLKGLSPVKRSDAPDGLIVMGEEKFTSLSQ